MKLEKNILIIVTNL